MPHLAVGADDAARVVAIVGRAFATDPVWSLAFPDQTRRAHQYEVFWTMLVNGAMRYQTVWLSEGGEAASVWLPPDGTELTASDEAAFEQVMTELLGPQVDRLLETVRRFGLARPAEPHYYLSLLATDPEHRGHGFGMALLRANLDAVDAAGAAAYLESTNPLNLVRYRRLGFVEFDTFRLPDDGPTVTKMWRDARLPADAAQSSE